MHAYSIRASLRGLSSGLIDTVDDLLAAWPRFDRAAARPPSELERVIAHAQFRSLMQESIPNLLAAVAGIVLFVLALWSVAPGLHLGVWAACAFAGSAEMAWFCARFMKVQPAADEISPWDLGVQRRIFVIGVLWGAVMLLPVPAHVVPYMATGLLLVVAGSVGLFATYRPGAPLIAVPCAVFASTALILTGHMLGLCAGIGFVVAVGLMVRLARVHNAAITQAMTVAEERKALLEELGLRRREAEHASAAKTRFLASVSHDLRQPMHSVALLVAEARQRGMADLDTVERIGASVQAMDDLLSALLEVSRLDAGAVALQLRVFPLAQVLERVRLQFDPQARAKGLALQVADSHALVHSDLFQIERVVSNLVANAIRYTHGGGVRVRCRARANTLWIQVWDSGVGIAREHLGKVFEEFFQVSRTARGGKQGLGLGLSIVQRTVHRLGYELRVRSRPGRGSLFEVGVPIAVHAASHAALLAPLLDGRLVLLIDDDSMVLRSMATLLTAFNCQVLSAGSMAEALRAVEDTLRLPDLIISDYRLGEHTGLDAIDQVRALAQEKIPALIVTAEPQSVVQPAVDVPILAKPLGPGALAAALQRVALVVMR